MRNLKVTDQAADCLAWFGDHDMYAEGDISAGIVALTEQWFLREGKDMDFCIGGEYQEFVANYGSPERKEQ